jgi:co-chaperonin GroES (HSP10)
MSETVPKINPENIEVHLNTVLIQQDRADAKVGSIIKPDSTVEVDNFNIMTGTVRKIGPMAFSFNTPGEANHWVDPAKPNEGDRIWFRKYAGGQMLEGADGNLYRFIDHMDVIATERANNE